MTYTRKFLMLSAILLIVVPKLCLAQQGYRITYANDPYDFPVTFNGEKRKVDGPTDKLIFNDSMSFTYRFMPGADRWKKRRLFGNKLDHHGVLFHKKTAVIYNMVAWPPGKDNEFMFTDSIKNENWTFLPFTKQILGYQCNGAISLTGNNDTTLVWYTKEIPQPYGPLNFFGFPGLVMEVTNQAYQWHLVATRVEQGDFAVVMPVGIRIISLAEALERFKKAKSSGPVIYKTKRQKRDPY